MHIFQKLIEVFTKVDNNSIDGKKIASLVFQHVDDTKKKVVVTLSNSSSLEKIDDIIKKIIVKLGDMKISYFWNGDTFIFPFNKEDIWMYRKQYLEYELSLLLDDFFSNDNATVNQSLSKHDELLLKVIDSWLVIILWENIKKFKLINQEYIFSKLINIVSFSFIVDNIEIFPLIDKLKFADILIRYWRTKLLADNLEKFPWINHQKVYNNLKHCFEGVRIIMKNYEKFIWLDRKDYVNFLIREDEWWLLIRNIEKFEFLDLLVIANKLIKRRIKYLADFLWKFEWLNLNIAIKLINEWYAKEVQENLKSFEWIDSIYKYLEYFPLISKNIFNIFYDLYKKNNVEKMNLLFEKINIAINQIINWEKMCINIKWITEKDITEFIYPIRNYSPENIDLYVDKSEHLKWYKFDRSGYNFTLSNLLWYRLIEWQKKDEAILDEFKIHVKNISEISKDENSLSNKVKEYCGKEDIVLESKTLEAQIMEYLLKKESSWKKIDIYDFDLIVAYQLMWKYEEFMNSSNDKLAMFEDAETRYMIQIQALLREYWDLLKETVKRLEKKSLEWQDSQYFEKYIIKVPKEVKNLTKSKNIQILISFFSKRSTETITDEVVRKIIYMRVKTVLSVIVNSQEEIDNFVNEFSASDFMFREDLELQEIFINKWKVKVEQYFWVGDKLWLNIRNIAKTQNEIYNWLQKESNKFESITDKWWMDKGRNVFARFWKTKCDAYARWVAGICIWVVEKMWDNENYFELVLFDKERKKCIWTVMLLTMQEPNWNKYLLFCPNPSEEFNDKVSSQLLYKKISKIIINFSIENDYDWILFDPIYWRATNRSWDFQKALEDSQLKDENNEIMKISLEKEYLLGGEYKYKNDLSFLWERKNDRKI